MLKFIMDNLIIVIPCITLLVLFYMYSNKSHEGITNIGSPKDENKSDVSEEDNEPFIPSESFIGEKSGYVFKNDNEGLGYYKDNTLIED
jgi:hypothetical protein